MFTKALNRIIEYTLTHYRIHYNRIIRLRALVFTLSFYNLVMEWIFEEQVVVYELRNVTDMADISVGEIFLVSRFKV